MCVFLEDKCTSYTGVVLDEKKDAKFGLSVDEGDGGGMIGAGSVQKWRCARF